MRKPLVAIIAALTIAASVVGCRTRKGPTLMTPYPVITQDEGVFPGTDILSRIKGRHGGFAGAGEGPDFDGDGAWDSFYAGRDGTIYATHSSDKPREDGSTAWYVYRGKLPK